MAITREEVLHVARLARLELTEDEVERFAGQLSAILEAVSKVSELDLVRRAADLAPARDRERVGRGRAAAVPAARRRVRERARPRRRLLPDAARMTVDTLRLSAEEAWKLLDAGEVSPRELWDAYRAAIDARERGAERVPDPRRRARRRRGADRAQGRDLDEGDPHDRGLEDPRELRAGLRLDRRRPLQGGRAARCSARRTPTSSRWARRPRTRPTGRRATRGTRRACRAAPAAARRPLSRPGSRRGRSARTPAARSSCPPRSAATSACGRPTARSRATGSSRSPRASTRSGPVTRNVRDNALLYSIISGRDENDSTTVDVPHGRASRGAAT